MHNLKLKTHIDTDGHLRLDVDTGLPAGEVALLLVINTSRLPSQSADAYNFKDLAGTLSWSGDATETQRALRDEWQ